MEKHDPPIFSTHTGKSKTQELDLPLHTLGFEIDDVTPSLVTGHLLITSKCCQPFKVLHGGVSALIAESLASIGAYVATGMKRVAGINLSIDHFKSAEIGDLLLVQSIPLNSGRTIQPPPFGDLITLSNLDVCFRIKVWEVKLWKTNPNNMKMKRLISSARVTLICNLPIPDHLQHVSEPFRRHSKL